MRASVYRFWSREPAREPVRRLHLDPDRRVAVRDGERIELTVREYALLEQLVQNSGQVRSTRELVVAVWGATMADRAEVVDEYVRRLRGKLGDSVIETVATGYRIRQSQ